MRTVQLRVEFLSRIRQMVSEARETLKAESKVLGFWRQTMN